MARHRRPPRLPRVCAEVRRPAALPVRAHRRLRPLERPLLDHVARQYEAKIVETFYEFLEKGFVYKGLKPVYWCIHDRTALAEAEVEYEMHTSPSIYVRYALTSDPGGDRPALAGKPVYTDHLDHHAVDAPGLARRSPSTPSSNTLRSRTRTGNVYIVAEALAAAAREGLQSEGCRRRSLDSRARKLERVTFQHPFLDRSILGVNADYVTTEQGTGAVHTAPAHGADDFYTGVRYGLRQDCDVDNARAHCAMVCPNTTASRSSRPTQPIIELLEARGALMGRSEIHHSYPHCWRCHNPIIFRATEQWFIGMETPMTAARRQRPPPSASGRSMRSSR